MLELWCVRFSHDDPDVLVANSDGTFVTLIRVYDGRVYVSDDETTMQVTIRKIPTDDKSKLIYFVEDDDGSGVALKGDRVVLWS